MGAHETDNNSSPPPPHSVTLEKQMPNRLLVNVAAWVEPITLNPHQGSLVMGKVVVQNFPNKYPVSVKGQTPPHFLPYTHPLFCSKVGPPTSVQLIVIFPWLGYELFPLLMLKIPSLQLLSSHPPLPSIVVLKQHTLIRWAQ